MGVLQPFSCETRTDYLRRFNANRDMRDLFGEPIHRASLANEAFRARWAKAMVTVRRLDGTEFFID